MNSEPMAPRNAARPTFAQLFIWGSARSQFWSSLVQGMGIANSFLLLKILSVYQYGLYQLVLAAIAILEAFSTNTLDAIAGNEVGRALADGKKGEAKQYFREVFFLKILVGAIGTIVLFVAADIVAGYYGRDIGGFIRLASILFLIAAAREAEALFFASTRTFAAFGAPMVQEVIRFAGMAAIWFLGMRGLTEIFAVSVLASFATLLYTTAFFVGEYRMLFGGVRRAGQRLLLGLVRRYGTLLVVRTGVSKALKQSDAWLVRLFLSTEAVGVYAAATNLITLAQGLFPLGMIGRLLPWEIGDPARFRYIYRRGTKYLFWFGLLVAVAAFFIVPLFIARFLPAYAPAMPIFRAFLVTLPIFGVYKFQKTILHVLREQRVMTMRVVTEALVTTGILAASLPFIGLYGAVIEYLVTFGGRVTLFSFYLARRYAHLSFPLRALFTFDRDDWLFFRRAIRELAHPQTWFRRVRIADLPADLP